ncbi:MAG: YgjP-like metallopeptidase domain-containing protein [Bacteroidaceae bacterium]|nr:M48 family metallopeptidase [Bacteroidaceae bacterium]
MQNCTIEDKELGLIKVQVNVRARQFVFHIKRDAIYVSVPPGVVTKDLKHALNNVRDKLIACRQNFPEPIIDLDYKIDAELFKLTLVEGSKDSFFAKTKLGSMQIICPPHTDFSDEQLQKWLRKVICESLRRNAKKILPPRLLALSREYELPFQKVSINSSRGRWGSCSVKKHINLSFFLLLLPSHLINYVLLHELSHTREMNHGEKFWKLLNNISKGKATVLKEEIKSYHTDI